MESLETLKSRRHNLASELELITIKKSGSTPWRPGVQDQYKSESYTYEEYTDVSKAYQLKAQIAKLDEEIRTYAERAKAENERLEAIKDSQTPQYDYVVAGRQETTKNPALAARYDAQHRLFGMNKVSRALMTLTGQKRKFKRLWIKATTSNEKSQEEIAMQLNKLFR